MGVIITPRKFIHKYNFKFEIDGFGWSGWTTCSELKVNTEIIEHREGGGRIAYKEVGLVTYDDITLERGSTTDVDSYEWFQTVYNADKNAGSVNPAYKKNAALVQFSEDNSEIQRWRIYGAFPNSFTSAAGDNTASEFAMEQIVLSIDYFTRAE